MSALPLDFFVAKDKLYDPLMFHCSMPLMEVESLEYGACFFTLNGKNIRFRTAKITPTKIGQFVTLWKRTGKSPVQPFDLSDSVDFFIVSVKSGDQVGQFIFPQSVLCEKDIVSKNGQGGKRAIRVYPSWDIPNNRQAEQTQKWQLDYFLEIPQDRPVDQTQARLLYGF